jgi:hypothetical protein
MLAYQNNRTEHFRALSDDNVVYDVVGSYQALLDKVMK